jgi:hypothetical protein
MAKQLNIFLENKPGRLAAVTQVLHERQVNIRAITIQDRGDFGLMKLLVDKPEEAKLAFTERGFACALKDVLAVRIPDEPGGLHRLAAVFLAHGINVVDGYGFVVESRKNAVWCFEADTIDRIKGIISKEGFEILEDPELYSL